MVRYRSMWVSVGVVLMATRCVAGGMAGGAPAPRAAQSEAASAPDSDAGRWLPVGSTVVMRRTGDIDGDGVDDLLIVGSVPGDAAAARPLVIVRGGVADGPGKVVTAPRAVPCAECGGMFGDPLKAIDVRPDGFTLQLEGGSRELWSQSFRFAWDAKAQEWRLAEVRTTVADRLEGSTKAASRGPEEFGVVRLMTFDSAEFPAE